MERKPNNNQEYSNQYRLIVDWHGQDIFPSDEIVEKYLIRAMADVGIKLPYGTNIIDYCLSTNIGVFRKVIDTLPELENYPPIKDSDIYFYTTNKTDKTTCQQSCEMCFLRGLPSYRVPLDKAAEISRDLNSQGFKVGLVPPDSFSDELINGDIDIQKQAGSAYRMDGLESTAWTSGAPIAKVENPDDLLTKGWDLLGYRSIQLNGQAIADTPIPFKGIINSSLLKSAIQRIQNWNKKSPDRQYKIGITFTISNRNNTTEYLKQMVEWCQNNGIFSIRFNSFSAFSGERYPQLKLEQYELTPNGVSEFYRNLKIILDEISVSSKDTKPKISFSEDFGSFGMEQIMDYIPEEFRNKSIGLCRAGSGLFALVQEGEKLNLYACVDRFFPKAGEVIQDENNYWTIKWNKNILKTIYYFRKAKTSDGSQILQGCIGGIAYTQNLNDQRLIEKLKQIE